MSAKKQLEHKSTLHYLVLLMFILIVTVSTIALLLDVKHKQSFVLLCLNIAGGTAAILGIIAVMRSKLLGIHGKSYLSLTIGLILWFLADLLVYYYFIVAGEEPIDISIIDVLYFIGYGFLSLHLFFIIKYIQRKINLTHVIIISILTTLFVIYISTNFIVTEFDISDKYISILVSLMYPILDLILIAPSAIILLSLRNDYKQSIPWFLSSLSLLINAIADDGYVVDFISDNSENLWLWELFYFVDFIIMSAALFWYNKFHISNNNEITHMSKQ
ncbi:MAG TPA: hypothetical protein VJU85_04720 [Nitrososphaeraceae archaeon]|nr:hypothetical protein [Nitrososphaeraceae archaeon]